MLKMIANQLFPNKSTSLASLAKEANVINTNAHSASGDAATLKQLLFVWALEFEVNVFEVKNSFQFSHTNFVR